MVRRGPDATDLRLVAAPGPARPQEAPLRDVEPPALAAVPTTTAGSPMPGPAAMIRTLIVDSHRLARTGIRVLLEDQADVSVAGEAATGEEAVELARQTRPDVVVIDTRVSGLDVVHTTRRIVADAPDDRTKVLLLMTTESDQCIVEALRAGARGLLVHDTDAQELLRAVRVVAVGEVVLSPGLMHRLIAQLVSLAPRRNPSPADLAELTAREREVMALVAAGLSNEEIAERLVVSPATAKTHVSRALRKLDARDRAQLVVLAYETGLVVSRHAGGAYRAGGERP
jgi:DNA-binding NarL/FixJ family response regulator